MGYYEIPFSASNLDNEKREELEHILSNKLISEALAAGGFIAGGWPRALLDPRKKNPLFPLDKKYTDIDIFFENTNQRNECLKKMPHSDEFRESKFASNFNISGVEKNYNDFLPKQSLSAPLPFAKWASVVPVQMITHDSLIHGSIENTLNSFDLKNCKVAIKGESFIIHDEYFDVQLSNKIHIEKCNSPYTLGRVNKYMNCYSYSDISEDSYALIDEWLLDAYRKFPDYDWMIEKSMIEDYVKACLRTTIRNRNISILENIMLFVGKWSVWTNYGNSDFIAEELNDREKKSVISSS